MVTSLLRNDEQLLWAARLISIATAKSLLRAGMFFLIMAAVFLFIAPWGQSLHQYCGSSSRCPIVFYGIWPYVAFSAMTGLMYLWSGWKAEHRPWFITYAVSNSRAFLIDESRPKDFRYIYLRLHPRRLGPSGILGFEGEAKGFVGLDPASTTRALYWTTEGPLIVAKDVEGPNP